MGTRIEREIDCIEKMIAMYCCAVHTPVASIDALAMCPQCAQLAAYASQRLQRCVFGEAKPVCAKCPIHCYRPELRQQMIAVMRFAGPRMLLTHPLLALQHMADAWRRTPRVKKTKKDIDNYRK